MEKVFFQDDLEKFSLACMLTHKTIYVHCGARPKNNGLVQIQTRPRSVLSEEKSQIKHYSVPIAPKKPFRGVTTPPTLRSPDEKLALTTSVHPPSI